MPLANLQARRAERLEALLRPSFTGRERVKLGLPAPIPCATARDTHAVSDAVGVRVLSNRSAS